MTHEPSLSSSRVSETCDLSSHVHGPRKKRGGGWHFLWRRHPCQFSCVPLLSHPSFSLSLSSPSLAPALLMIPRQDAELAWGSKVIFPPLLCHFLLFVTAFHWSVRAEKINEIPALPYQQITLCSMNGTDHAVVILGNQTMLQWRRQHRLPSHHPTIHPCPLPSPPPL